MATSAHAPSIVDQFRCALEACDKAHAQVCESTPCASLPPSQMMRPRVTFAPVPQQVVPEVMWPAGVQAPVALPVGAMRPAPPPPAPSTGPSAWRLLACALLAGAVAAIAFYLRGRFVLPRLGWRKAIKPESEGEEEEEEPPAPQDRRRRSRARENGRRDQSGGLEPGGLSAMAAYFRAQQSTDGSPEPRPTEQAPKVSHQQPPRPPPVLRAPVRSNGAAAAPKAETPAAGVDLRAVNFAADVQKRAAAAAAPEPETPALFFPEAEEADPNFVPI